MLIVVASNAPVYTRRSLLVADDPQAPSDRRSCVRCTSRRWHLLVYTGRAGHPGGAAPGGRMAAVRRYHRWPVVSKCALREGRQRERSTQVIPDAPPSVPSCWSITAFPACVILPQMNRQPMCIWVVKPPFTQYIPIGAGTHLDGKFFVWLRQKLLKSVRIPASFFLARQKIFLANLHTVTYWYSFLPPNGCRTFQ